MWLYVNVNAAGAQEEEAPPHLSAERTRDLPRDARVAHHRQPMMRIFRTLFAASVAWTVLASGARTPDAPPTIETPAAAVPGDASVIALVPGGGINRGNILEAPNDGASGHRFVVDVLDIWRQLTAGFGRYQQGTEGASRSVAPCAVTQG